MKTKRRIRSFAVLFHNLGARWCGQRCALAALLPGNKPGTHCIGGWVDHRADLNRCRKFRPHRDSIHTNNILFVYFKLYVKISYLPHKNTFCAIINRIIKTRVLTVCR